MPAPRISPAGVALALVWPAAFARAACGGQKRRFFTTGEAGDRPGFECLACPTQNVSAYVEHPNGHPAGFSEAEQFVLDYWAAMDKGNFSFLVGSYAGSGSLIRAGGPVMFGNQVKNASNPFPFNGSLPYDDQAALGGLIYFFYSTGDGKWNGNGGVFAVANGTGGLHVALQDTVQVSRDFAIITTIINGTRHFKANGLPMFPWASMKQSITVRKFGGGLGWKIVHFTCSFYSFSWLGAPGLQCSPGASNGIPPPHVDWSAADTYSVKFTDPANYCSSRCPCGEAPVAVTDCDEEEEADAPGDAEGEVGYRSDMYLSDVPGPAPGTFCFPCATSAEPRPKFHPASPERFVVDFVRALGRGDLQAADRYSSHAVILRNGGPAITGPPSASDIGGHGKEFFTELWPGLTFRGSGGATAELHVAVQRTLRVARRAAQVLLFVNGTLYSKRTGKVAVPWAAKKLAVSVIREWSAWKVVSLSVLDYNTNGISRCHADGVNNTYCLSRCPCGQFEPLPADVAKAEGVSYHTVRENLI